MRSSVVQEVEFPKQPSLQSIYDTAPIGLAYLSPDCRYLQINQRLTEICGISVEGHLDHTVRDCVPGLADAVEEIVRSIMETGNPVTGIEVSGQRTGQNEDRCWITHWHPQRGPNGNIVGVNVAAEEITERKRHEQEIGRAREAAEAALHHLQETQASLIESEKLAALGRLVAGIAHEINSPVGTSLTVASVLERKREQFALKVGSGALKRSSLNEFLEAIEDASKLLVVNLERAADLVQSFKQVAADKSYLDQQAFDLGDFTKQVLSIFRSALQKNNLTLNLESEANLEMDSYPGPYGQALTNLFLNSVTHAFPDGKGGRIDIVLRRFGRDHVEILFDDDGCGMSLDVRHQAFNPFFTTRRDSGRIGLGLHIVHNIVNNRLGGELELHSAPGNGTKIIITLPRMAPGQS